MKKPFKIAMIIAFLIACLFAGMAVGNNANTSLNSYPYGEVCGGSSCVDNYNYTCCLNYATGGCTDCIPPPPVQ